MLELRRLSKSFNKSSPLALNDVSLSVAEGDFVMLLGLSGSGKTTLLRCINFLQKPSTGSIFFMGNEIKDKKSIAVARKKIGMVFQNFNLVEQLTVLQNVLCGRLPYAHKLLSCLKMFSTEDIDIALDCIRQVGLEDKIYTKAKHLSGGQRQRVGIARALAQKPTLLLADEPVASLDPKTSRQVLNILKDINEKYKITTIISNHNLGLALEYGNRIVGLKGGKIVLDKMKNKIGDSEISALYGGNYEE